jgi:hypothetical protein
LNTRLLVLFLLSFLAGCAATGPADDGYDNSNEWVDNGRLLSNDSKVVYSSQQQSGETVTTSESESNSNSAKDFTAYKQWLEAKENNTGEYQKFQQWQEFETFQRWKEQQKSE